MNREIKQKNIIGTDNYEIECKRCELNAIARRDYRYEIWPDQSLAKTPILRPYRCIIMNPTADGGMPHTRGEGERGGIICIPAHYPESRLSETLKHELIHIDQRINSEKWKKRLLEEGWTIEDEEEIPEEWRRRCRLNPDTLKCRFVGWEGRYIPMPLFEREDKPQLREIQIRWWDKQEKKVRILAPVSYIRKYGERGVSEMEHPYELWAYNAEKE